MGLLSDEYREALRSEPSKRVTPAAPKPVSPAVQTERFGGEVGSQNYWDHQAARPALSRLPREIGSAFGVQLPDEQTFDRMSRQDQISAVGKASADAAAGMIVNLPRAVVRDALSVGATAIAPFRAILSGRSPSADALGKEPKINLPWVGDVPTMYQTQADAEAAGMGPVASRVMAGLILPLQVAQTAGLAELAANAFRPRGTIAPGTTLKTTEPVKQLIAKDAAGKTRTLTRPEGSMSEYYTMPKTDVKAFGGTVNDIHWKYTPVGDGKVELSVVRVIGGEKDLGSTIKTPYGVRTVERGDWGAEVKLQSEVVDRGPKPLQVDVPAGEKAPVLFIEPRPKKGFENKPVTEQQLGNLATISKINDIDSGVASAVARTITGKKAFGEMTQAEYTRVAQALGVFGKQYIPDASMSPTGWVRSALSPQRHFFDYVEERYGVPLKTKVYNPIEEGSRLARNLSDSLSQEFNDMWGKYSGAKYVEERRLIDSYMRGDETPLMTSPAITAAERTDLLQLAGKVREFYNKTGPVLDVPYEIFVKDYLPGIRDIGGVFQRYKNLDAAPAATTFFAKFKKKGGLEAMIDDPLVTGHIYIRQGSKALHMGKALDDAKALTENLPTNLKRAANSYIQEKLGFSGKVEEFLDSFVPAMNKKMNFLNLPPDFSRQMSGYLLSSFYAGMLSSPATWFRQSLQLPMYVYGRLGSKFMGQAAAKSMTRAGRAEVEKSGMLVDTVSPYGEELAQEFNPVGRAGVAFKKGTQVIIKPNSMVDNHVRTITFHQSKMIFDDAIAQFNSGKATWQQAESLMDLRSFPVHDRNVIRQRLASGDIDGARTKYISDIIDETSFPYRRATSAKITYGLTGKMTTGLMTYSIESANVLTKWARNKEWEKIIRFAAGASAVNSTLKDDFGVDFGKSFNLFSQFGNVFSPFMQGFIALGQGMQAAASDNREKFNESSDEIVKLVTSALPAGVATKNAARFLKSYKAGPDESGQYAIYDQYGKLTRNGDFAELFWSTLLGFPTNDRVGESDTNRAMKNAQFEQQEVQEKMNELLRNEKYDELDAMIEKYGIGPSGSAMTSQFVPRNERMFKALPANLKAKFAPQVFPE